MIVTHVVIHRRGHEDILQHGVGHVALLSSLLPPAAEWLHGHVGDVGERW